jgi:hypothetical protein
MAVRQPTAVGAFFAQSAAGAQRQKEAREKLKKPQALGGAASAGTQMIASSTKTLQQETGNVNKQAQSASTELVAGDVGNKTANLIGGTPVSSPGTATATTPGTATSTEYAGGISGLASSTPKLQTVSSGDTASSATINAEGQIIDFNIKHISDKITSLESSLSNANAEDAAAISAEIARLKGLQDNYQKMIDEGNLGQVAGPSALETQLQEREQLLASQDAYLEDGTDSSIAKLSAVFGPRWKKRSEQSKALAAQAYGKDLEALGEEAAAGLREKERAEEESDLAMQGLTGTLETRKKEYEEKLKNQSEKVEILKKSPDELKTYTRTQLEKLFGKDQANQLFQFTSNDPNATVSGTTASATRNALQSALDAQKLEKDKVAVEAKKSDDRIAALDQEYTSVYDRLKGMETTRDELGPKYQAAKEGLRQLNDLPWYSKKSGHSKKVWEAEQRVKELERAMTKRAYILKQIYKVNKDTTRSTQQKLDDLKVILQDYSQIGTEVLKKI